MILVMETLLVKRRVNVCGADAEYKKIILGLQYTIEE